MNPSNESTDNVLSVSQKVQNLIETTPSTLSEKVLRLPNNKYQPFFLKVVNDFISHHKLPQGLQMPSGNLKLHLALSLILDVMVRSMGEAKRDEIIQELEEYKLGLPREDRD